MGGGACGPGIVPGRRQNFPLIPQLKAGKGGGDISLSSVRGYWFFHDAFFQQVSKISFIFHFRAF